MKRKNQKIEMTNSFLLNHINILFYNQLTNNQHGLNTKQTYTCRMGNH